jgi:hypothetical protein
MLASHMPRNGTCDERAERLRRFAMANFDRKRRGELLRAVFAVPDGIRAKDALADAEKRLTLTDYEAGAFESTGVRRYEKLPQTGPSNWAAFLARWAAGRSGSEDGPVMSPHRSNPVRRQDPLLSQGPGPSRRQVFRDV